MGTDTTISVEDFTAEAVAFLDANAEKRPPARDFTWGEGSDEVALFDEKDRATEAAEAEEAKAWRRKRFDAGLGWITGPLTYGGRELSAAHERAYNAIEAGYVTPGMGVFTISLGMVAPTILAHGTEEVRDLYLRDLYRGDLVGCQLFSEPGSGSDLASISTKAVRDGDEWILSGQKVWTSAAHLSQIGEIICRTDPTLPKHRGMTAFVVDMSAPGVTIRPLKQMTGGSSFNEVFFDEVRVHDSHRLGDVNGGWTVALTTLMNERASIGGGGTGGGAGLTTPGRIHAMLEHFGLEDDKVARDEVTRIYTNFVVAKWNNQRALDKIKAGGLPGPELSTAKLALTNNLKAYSEWAASVLGPRITADSGEWGTFAFSRMLCGVPGMRVAGGTDEVMRNIVAEQVLGLPKGPGVDKNLPFADLEVGTRRAD
ncbi:MAG: acyl-CoA dehydrogenase family protein [Microthrixaceae bacterium]|nr:acyl-CoA dehydrogenase family protein [Microthrixaceae bacterium]